MIDFLSKKTVVLLETETPGTSKEIDIDDAKSEAPRSTVVLPDTQTPCTSREIYSEDTEGKDRTRNPCIKNLVL